MWKFSVGSSVLTNVIRMPLTHAKVDFRSHMKLVSWYLCATGRKVCLSRL